MTEGVDQQAVNPKALKPGTRVRYNNGHIVVLKDRKADDTGWWNTDGSGLADRAFALDDWTVLPTEHTIRYVRTMTVEGDLDQADLLHMARESFEDEGALWNVEIDGRTFTLR